jgi:hypothetical protein
MKRSLKISILTLASLLGLVLAAVRYSIAPSSASSTVTQPLPVPQVKPFSILDYLPSSSLMEAPSSIMPDVRLIKNALTLSTKASPPTISNVPPPKSKLNSKSTGTFAVALPDSDYGLMTFLQNSGSTWRKAKEMVSPSPPIVTAIAEEPRGYGQIMLSDLKTAWSKTLSTYSHAEFIHYIRDQVIATILLEIQQAILLAQYLMEVGKNASRIAQPYIHRGVEHAATLYGSMKTYTYSIHMPTTEIVANVAKSGIDSVTSKAVMTSQKGREAIQQARLGLEYLVSEAKRRAGLTPVEVNVKEELPGGRFSGLRNKIRTHRGKAVQNPRKSVTKKADVKMESKERKMTMRERLMLALHNVSQIPHFVINGYSTNQAAMPLVV